MPTIGNVMLCSGPGMSTKDFRSNSIDHNKSLFSASTLAADAIVLTKVITDSATITIPLKGTGALIASDVETDLFPKFKTMPSPTKNNSILNEIHEEGTDIGSSDTSATTTPRPITRHSTQFTNQGPVQRRAKFNKTRTASCSSSDASDDDSENRKKRAHKIVDSASKRFGQRRDSYDDSSDSQEPGSLAQGTGGQGTSTGEYYCSGTDQDKEGGQSTSNGHVGGGGGSGKGQQQMGFSRRNRAGRRKAGETRLRESQSLNRITEVQESDILSGGSQNANLPTSGVGGQQAPLAQSEITDSRVPSPESLSPDVAVQEDKGEEVTRQVTAVEGKKAKGFSARLLQGFKNRGAKQEISDSGLKEGQLLGEREDGVDSGGKGIMKENAEPKAQNGGGTGATTTRKLKMLGKYFQVSGGGWS